MMPGQAQNQPPKPRGTHWKLIAGLIAGILLLVIVAICGFVIFIMSLLKNSDVAKQALARARSNPGVVEHLGTPIKAGWFVSGSINLHDSSGDADLTMPISGPKGKGTIHLTAHKSAGTWTFSVLQVELEGSKEKIDLLAQLNVAWAPESWLSFASTSPA
jgi:hypothetical protein